MNKKPQSGFQKHFAKVPDPRVVGRTWHKLFSSCFFSASFMAKSDAQNIFRQGLAPLYPINTATTNRKHA